jgi:hypothetical protein
MISSDSRLIRLIAGRYRELQGWGTVANAGFLPLMAAAVREPSPTRIVMWIAAFGAYAIVWDLWFRLKIERYYATRFGRVGGAESFSTHPGVEYGFIGFFFVALLFDQQAPPLALGAYIMMAALTCPFAWIVVRDWPHRGHWLLPVAVGASSGLRLLSVVTPADLRDWEVLVCVAGSLAIAAAGLLDHRLLAKTLTAGAAEHVPAAQHPSA